MATLAVRLAVALTGVVTAVMGTIDLRDLFVGRGEEDPAALER